MSITLSFGRMGRWAFSENLRTRARYIPGVAKDGSISLFRGYDARYTWQERR